MMVEPLVLALSLVAGGIIVLWLRPSYRLALSDLFNENFLGKVKDQYVRKTSIGLKVEKDGVVSQIVAQEGAGIKQFVKLANGQECRPFIMDFCDYNTGHFKDSKALFLNPEEAVFVYDDSQNKLNELSRVYGGDTKVSGSYDSDDDAESRSMNKLNEVADVANKLVQAAGVKRRGVDEK